MIKFNVLFLIIISSFMISCRSYHKLKPTHFKKQNLLKEKWMDIKDFKIHTFNICEFYSNTVNPKERFISCPDNFFEISARDSIKKVEELYLLTHKKSGLIVYTTSFSHKYLKRQKGFLNDSLQYKNKFYLRDMEYIYVGKNNLQKHSIFFEKQKKHSNNTPRFHPGGDANMIWYYQEYSSSSKEIKIDSVNIETVENKGDLNDTIALDQVFSVPFNFKASDYSLYNTNTKNLRKEISKICFLKKSNGLYEVLFKVRGINEGYRFPSAKVLYFTKQ